MEQAGTIAASRRLLNAVVPATLWLAAATAGFAAGTPAAGNAESPAPPKLELISPVDRHVFQRQTEESGFVLLVLRGVPKGTNTSIEARLTRLDKARRGKDVDWTRIALQPAKADWAGNDWKGWAGKPLVNVGVKGDTFMAELPAAAGGWYRLDVRVMDGGKVSAEASVARVGIGEVFITAGQSNSSNWGEGENEAKDDRVVYVAGDPRGYEYGRSFVPARDPLPGSYGEKREKNHGNQYPFLGDRLVAAWGVPVAFRSATIAATPVAEWMPGAGQGDPQSGYQQFQNLVYTVLAFGPRGVRAVLWHQGEYDAIFGTPDELYRDILSYIIRRMRKEVGYEVDWFVAEAWNANAQKMLWDSKVCFQGPLSRDLRRYDSAHFSKDSHEKLAQRWFEVLNKQYGAGKPVEAPK